MNVFKAPCWNQVPTGAETVEKDGGRFVCLKRGKRQFLAQASIDGKRYKSETAHYYARIRMASGKIERVPLRGPSGNRITDERAAQTIAEKLQQDEDRKSAGIFDPVVEHADKPLIGSPNHIKQTRGKRGIKTTDQNRLTVNDAIEGSFLADYFQHLIAKASAKHAYQTVRNLHAVCRECGFLFLGDLINGEGRLLTFLQHRLSAGASHRTHNFDLVAIRGFANYLDRKGFLVGNPFRNVDRLNEESDPNRRERRPLTPEEFTLLFQTVMADPKVEGISGIDRAMLYIVATWSGYRRKELASLTPSSFRLDDATPTVKAKGWSTKAKRDDPPIPLSSEVVAILRPWLADKPRSEPLWNISNRDTAKMIKKDLARARTTWLTDGGDEESEFLCYQSDDGFADFHASRVAFISNLARSDVPFATVVALARHSDPKLTMRVYAKIGLADRVAAIARLPKPPALG